MHADVENGFMAFNEPLEGRVDFMYLDVRGLVTTGIGNLIGAGNQLLPDVHTLG